MSFRLTIITNRSVLIFQEKVVGVWLYLTNKSVERLAVNRISCYEQDSEVIESFRLYVQTLGDYYIIFGGKIVELGCVMSHIMHQSYP